MPQNILDDLALTPFVFVYGTLKRGFGNNSLLKSAEFVCQTLTKYEEYLLYNIGIPYLTVVNDHRSRRVAGEVYKVDEQTLIDLDRLEGVDYDHYTRDLISVGGVDKLAWCYKATQSTLEGLPESYCPAEKGYYNYVGR